MALSLSRLTAARQKVQVFRALRHRNYRLFWFSSMGQSVGMGMQQLTLGWLVLELTDSVSALGLVVFLQGIPQAGFMVFGGVFADRIDRRKVLIASQVIVTNIIVVLGVLTVTDHIRIWHIYITAILTGTVGAVNGPARMAIVRDLVEREDIMNAVGLNSSLMNTSRIIGPFVAGAFIEWIGIGPTLFASACGYVVGTIGLVFIRGTFRLAAATRRSVGRDLLEGVRYVWTAPAVLTIIVMGFAMGFFGQAYLQMMPAFAREVLEVGAGRAGLLMMGAGLGSLAGTLILASLGDFRYKHLLLLGTVLLFAIALFFFALAPSFSLALVALPLVGMGGMTFVAMGTTLLQLLAPPALQGRILSLWMIGGSFQFVGALPMGFVGDAMGLRFAIAGGAVICLALVFWLGVVRPPIRRLAI